ncbi:WD40-repeat-containing domain protein [Boletus coccyginus]|nr:WD40-repeat-containing domain protein [Boletus coccyginus]
MSSPSSGQRYKMVGRLNGGVDNAINCLAINGQGTFLTGGSNDGMKIWNMDKLEEIPSVARRHAFNDPISAAMWITRKDEAHETLCFGTSLGYLIFWRQNKGSRMQIQFEEVTLKRIGTSCEITCMACDTTQRAGVRIAAATRERHIVVWTFEGNLLTPTLSVQLNTTVPKGIAFSGQNDLQVWGMYDGLMLTIRGDGRVVKSTELSTAIGGVALHEKQSTFVIDNVTDGFSLHNVESGNLLLSGENGAMVIGGGDRGEVYVFDRKTGTLVQALRHADKGLVQSIGVHDGESYNTIVVATSRTEPRPTISIWRYKRSRESMPEKREQGGIVRSLDWSFQVALRAVILGILITLFIDALKHGLQVDSWRDSRTSALFANIIQSSPESNMAKAFVPMAETDSRQRPTKLTEEESRMVKASREAWKRELQSPPVTTAEEEASREAWKRELQSPPDTTTGGEASQEAWTRELQFGRKG